MEEGRYSVDHTGTDKIKSTIGFHLEEDMHSFANEDKIWKNPLEKVKQLIDTSSRELVVIF